MAAGGEETEYEDAGEVGSDMEDVSASPPRASSSPEPPVGGVGSLDPPRKRMSSKKSKQSDNQRNIANTLSAKSAKSATSCDTSTSDMQAVAASDDVENDQEEQDDDDEEDEKEKLQTPEQKRAPPAHVREWKGLDTMPNQTQAAITHALARARTEGKDHLKVLVLGKAGVGKSSTINALLNERVAPVSTFQPEESKATTYSRWAAGVTLTLVDTPALVDGDLPSETTLSEITSQLAGKSIDALLYVDRLDAWRIGQRDRATIHAITEHFGPNAWQSTMLTFTHGQLAAAPPELGFSAYEQERANVMKDTIRSEGQNEDAELPAVSVENKGTCRTNANGEKVLPDERRWVPHFFETLTYVCMQTEPVQVPKEADQVADVAHSHHKKHKRWLPLIVAAQAFILRPLFQFVIKADRKRARSR